MLLSNSLPLSSDRTCHLPLINRIWQIRWNISHYLNLPLSRLKENIFFLVIEESNIYVVSFLWQENVRSLGTENGPWLIANKKTGMSALKLQGTELFQQPYCKEVSQLQNGMELGQCFDCSLLRT